MKKTFLSFFVTIIGLTSFVHAQAPCSTVQQCEALRTEWARPELTGRVKSDINKRIDKQIILLAKYWPQKDSVVNNLRWSIVVKGKYENLSLDLDRAVINGVIQQSQATEACRLIGGRLPAKEDFTDLKDLWDDRSIVSAKFRQTMNNKTFWTSTATSYLNVDAHYFNGTAGAFGIDNRITKKSVRCVLGSN